jgi:signal transduction histidine kinase
MQVRLHLPAESRLNTNTVQIRQHLVGVTLVVARPGPLRRDVSMKASGQSKLQRQLVLIMLAAVFVAASAALMVLEAARGAERAILSDSSRVLAEAAAELKQQYQDRLNLGASLLKLPLAAQNVSLRGISAAVLSAYPGVEGGYFRNGNFLGYAFPTHDNPAAKTDVPAAELDSIQAAAEECLKQRRAVERSIRDPYEVVLIRAQPDRDGSAAAWVMKRVPLNDPAARWLDWLLAALGIASLLSVAGTLALALDLRRGVNAIIHGLDRLEQDFTYRLPEPPSELGLISSAINKMARVRRQLESDLRREDRLRAMGRLIAGVAHEIRNPLNSIRLSIELLGRRLEDHSASFQDLGLVIDEVDRLEALLKNFFAFHKGASPKLETLALLPVLKRNLRLVEPQAAEKRVKLQFDVENSDAAAEFDPAQLSQALLNLILNALEAAGEGGSVTLRLEQTPKAVEIEVADSGPGIPEDQQDRVFEAFYTTKSNGAGLGLAVSRELVENMGGRLYYRNRAQGASFVIELPPAHHA